MRLSDVALEKADPALRNALANAEAAAPVRVIITLGDQEPAGVRPNSPRTLGSFRTTKAGSPTGTVNRRALIEDRRRSFAGSYGSLRKSLAGMGLRVSGGELTRAVVLEGGAADIAAALALPLVRRAILDQRIVNSPVIRKRVSRFAPTATARVKPAKPAKAVVERGRRTRRSGAVARKRP